MKKKLIISIIIILLISLVFLSKTYAISEIKQQADDFIRYGAQQDTVVNYNKAKTNSNKIFNILFSIGTIMSAVIAAVLGISFILASAEGKAKITEALVPYIIGCVIVFGAFGIWKLVVDIGSDVTDSPIYNPTNNNVSHAQSEY